VGGLLERRLLFVTGKGGVGKTTVAAALALLGSQKGKKTLACELDAKGNLAEFFEAGRTTFKPREVQPRLFALSVDSEESLKEYLVLNLRLPVLSRIGPLARLFDFAAVAAPGVKEILTVGKPVYEAHEGHYDLVVVDATATGHVLAQLGAPRVINELVHVGLVRNQTTWMLDVLSDPAQTGVVIVTTPEEMPVSETIELADRVEPETGVDLAAVVVNRVLPELFGRGEEEVFERLEEPSTASAISGAAGGDVAPLFAAARLAVTLRRTRAEHLERLRKGVESDVPVLYVPYLFGRSHGLRSTHQVAEALADELGY
jgi:anion-transporting  ArsA/GET3 family ATPase